MRTGRTISVLATGLVASAALLSAACTSDCNRDSNTPVEEYTDGTTFDGVYESSPFYGPYLNFPSGTRWEIFHDLGAIPRSAVANLAFDPCPMTDPCGSEQGAGTGLTFASGNAVTFENVGAQSIVVKNDTCADFFLRVVLSDPAQQ